MSALATMLSLFDQLSLAERQALKTVIDSKMISPVTLVTAEPPKKQRKPRTVDPTKPKVKPDNSAYRAWYAENGKTIREAFATAHPELKGVELTKGKNQAVKDSWNEAKKTIKPTSSTSLNDIKAEMSDDTNDVDIDDVEEIED